MPRAMRKRSSAHKRLAEKPMTEADILHDNGLFWVRENRRGDFEVYRSGLTHSTRVALFGHGLKNAFKRACNEADRRHAVDAYADPERQFGRNV